MAVHTIRVSRRTALATAAVVTALTAGVVGSAAARHDVTVVVDHQIEHISTFAGTAGGAVEAAGLHVGPHDLLLPNADATVTDGSVVSLTRGRQIKLTVDGATRTVWVAATDVNAALAALDLDGRGAAVSASRSYRIPPSGLALTVRLPHDVTIVADGRPRTLKTTAATVGDLLTEAGITLAGTDKVSPALGSYPADGATVTVSRIRQRVVTDRTPIPAPAEQRATAALPTGTTRVLEAGASGVRATTIIETVVDGKVTARTATGNHVEIPAQPRIVETGTAPQAPQMVAPRSSDGLNWAALAQCESGGNPGSVSASGAYRGLYQFSFGTWASVGGSGDPAAASPAEQTRRAQILYARSGAGQWPVCGRLL